MIQSKHPNGLEILWNGLRQFKWIVISALFTLFLSVLASLSGPFFVQQFVDQAISFGSLGTLLYYALGYLILAVFAGVLRWLAGYLTVQTAWQIADHLRSSVLRQVVGGEPILKIEGRPFGEVLEQVEGNADIIGRSIVESGFRLLGNTALAIGTLLILFIKIPKAAFGISVALMLTLFVVRRLGQISIHRWKNVRHQQMSLFGFIGDALAARDDLLLLSESKWAIGHVRQSLDALYQSEERAYVSGRAFWPVVQLFLAAAFGFGFAFGLRLLELGTITVGTIMTVYLYIDLLQKPLEEMSSQAGQLQRMIAVLSMTAQFFSERIGPLQVTKKMSMGALSVSFDHVTFGYDHGSSVLHDISFHVEAGTSLGIIGRTGAGKSTIVNLLCGLVKPHHGRVLIGGFDISEISPEEFANRVAVLSQRAHVFSASVRDNVAMFSPTIQDKRVWEVFERLGVEKWIQALPDGLDTQIGVGGYPLARGELQMITGARAILRSADLLIIDEGTSQMDTQTEQNWSHLIDIVSHGRTVIMVEHRHVALSRVDHLIQIENGRVVKAYSPGNFISSQDALS